MAMMIGTMTMTNSLFSTRRAAAAAFVQRKREAWQTSWSDLNYAYDYETEDAMYLGWVDLDPKKTTEQKIAEACAAFTARFGTRPTVILVNEAERVTVAGVDIRSEGYIRRNNYWVGMIAE